MVFPPGKEASKWLLATDALYFVSLGPEYGVKSEEVIHHLITRFEPEVLQPFVTFSSPTSGEPILRYRTLLCEIDYLDHPDGILHLLVALRNTPEALSETILLFLAEVFPPRVLMEHLNDEMRSFGVPEMIQSFGNWTTMIRDGTTYLDVQIPFRWHRRCSRPVG